MSKIYQDDESGSKRERDALNRLLNQLRVGDWFVVVWRSIDCQSRFEISSISLKPSILKV